MLSLGVLVAACTQTSYLSHDETSAPPPDLNPFERRIEYDIDLAVTTRSTKCIVVAPATVAEGLRSDPTIAATVTQLILLQLKMKLGEPAVVEVDGDADLAQLEAALHNCAYVFRASVTVEDSTYLFVWSRKRVGIKAELIDVQDQNVVWWARHTAMRSAGRLPLSPIGAAVTIFQTGDFAADDDIRPSIVNDAVRRVLTTFPSLAMSDAG